jgi:cytochrome c biogenesis protein CcmG/thiol:disulfide interchange protein DsbE
VDGGERTSGRWIRRAAWIVLAATALWFWTWQATRLRLVAPEAAPSAPALALRSSDGQTIDLSELRGRIVLVNLWASWCPPCRQETPGLVRVYEEYRDQGFEILGINAESLDPEALQRVVGEWGVSYPVGVPIAPLEGTFGGQGVLPTSWLIDAAGRVRAVHSGYLLESSLRSAVRRLLDESPD